MNTYIFSGNRLDANQHLRSQKIQDLIAYCRRCSQTGDAVNMGQAAFETSMNLLWSTIFSKDVVDPYANSDPQGIRRSVGKNFYKLLQQIEVLIDERLEQRRTSPTSDSTNVLDVLLNTS
nr:geraniol 8-hydroxylase-like [Nicotiana tomentosiformis]